MEQEKRDPRAERTRLAMIKAVSQIIVEEGASAVTHQRVAERAGVGRATVYRHWPTADDILLSVFELFRFPTVVTEAGSLQQRLTALLQWIGTQFAQPEVRAFILTIADRSRQDPNIERVQRKRMLKFQQGIGQVLRDANVSIDEPLDAIMARLVGPIWFRVLIQGQIADDPFVEAIVHDFLSHTSCTQVPDDNLGL